jgi:hypothetical protein
MCKIKRKIVIKSKNKQTLKQEEAHKNDVSLFATLGLGNVETILHKIPLIGKALPFLIINLLAATIFYYLCYGGLWLFSAKPEEEGQWFARRVDILGKEHSRYTTHAAEHIAYFTAGIAACLFTYDNYSVNDKRHFLLRTALVSLIPICLLIIIKISKSTFVYIPMGFIYGQFVAIIIVCIIKLFGGDKKVTHAKS